MLVTTTETEQAALGGTTVAEVTVKESAPAVAVTLEFTQVVAGKGADALVIPTG
jgi:hypothetical protein